MRNKKKSQISVLLLILLGLSIGFAALATTLKINGTTIITKNTWNVYWDNIDNEDGVTPTSITIDDESESNKDNIVNFSVTLDKPGDYFEFTVDAVNAGTIDAEILSIEKKYNDTVIPETGTSPLPSYLKYEVTYEDGSEISVGDGLAKAQDLTSNPPVYTTKTYKIRVEYDRDAVTNADINNQVGNVTCEFSFKVDYGQATPSEGDAIAQRIAEIEADPDEYRNPQQNVSNKDIAIDINGNVLNLDRWIGYMYDPYASYDDPYDYYDLSEYAKAYADNGDGTATIGGCNDIISMATASETIVNGEWIEPIPAYIMFAGTDSFIPVTTTACLFARVNYDSSQRTTITEYPNFPETITNIDGGTFQNIQTFENVTIPKQIKSIGFYAFGSAFNSSGLNNTLTFEEGSQLEYIDDGAFIYNNFCGSIVLPSNLKKIKDSAFTQNHLTSVSLPTSAEYYDNYYDTEYNRTLDSFDSGTTIIRY